jgi:hypothetical protein
VIINQNGLYNLFNFPLYVQDSFSIAFGALNSASYEAPENMANLSLTLLVNRDYLRFIYMLILALFCQY